MNPLDAGNRAAGVLVDTIVSYANDVTVILFAAIVYVYMVDFKSVLMSWQDNR